MKEYEEVSEDDLNPSNRFLIRFYLRKESGNIIKQAMDSLGDTPEWQAYIAARDAAYETNEYKALVGHSPKDKLIKSLPLSRVRLDDDEESDWTEELAELYEAYWDTPEREAFVRSWVAYFALLDDKMRAQKLKKEEWKALYAKFKEFEATYEVGDDE